MLFSNSAMKNIFIKTLLLLFMLLFPAIAFSTTDYSRDTGKSCLACHVDPAGGGKLTAEGEAYKNELQSKGLYRPLSPAMHFVRFIMGYVHAMTAVLWFGTILYVHILLKPAYASRGLPKGELTLGWLSITIMLITGALLTIAKIPSWNMLFNTRFGILLLIKIALFLIMAATATTVTFFIGPRLKKRQELSIQNKRDMTLTEFAHFDGKDGMPAYVAYDGNIYDVTNSRLWQEGNHMRKHLPGFDLTDAIKIAPHGEDKILSMPLVGKLLAGERKRPFHERLFFFLAYMSLVLTFVVIFIISLWNWW